MIWLGYVFAAAGRLAWKAVVKRAAVVAVAGLTIYLVFPAITEMLASWPRLSTLHPWWFTVAIAAEVAAVQFRMLATSGSDMSSTMGGLAAFSLLGVGGLLALPVFSSRLRT